MPSVVDVAEHRQRNKDLPPKKRVWGFRAPARHRIRKSASQVAQAHREIRLTVTITVSGIRDWYINDHLGTPQKLVDEAGTVVWAADYKAFGEATVTTATITNNLRFPGQYYDAETGLHYNWMRYYDPGTGRYTQVDPIGFGGGDENLYRYVLNSPQGGFDPAGLEWYNDTDDFLRLTGNAAAGFGDTLTFGLTSKIRQVNGADTMVDRCSGAFAVGGWAGEAWFMTVGGGIGWRSALKKPGTVFSHWIPDRARRWPGFNNRVGKWILKNGNLWNGNYVSRARHYYHDNHYFPRGWRDLGSKWPRLLQQLDRVPNVFKGIGIGGAIVEGARRSQ